MKKLWTDEETERLREMVKNDIGHQRIAAVLGRSVSSISSKIIHINLALERSSAKYCEMLGRRHIKSKAKAAVINKPVRLEPERVILPTLPRTRDLLHTSYVPPPEICMRDGALDAKDLPSRSTGAEVGWHDRGHA